MEITGDEIIGRVVAHDYGTAEIFSVFGIDFCCRGNRTIKEACANGKANLEVLLAALLTIQDKKNSGENWNTWSMDLLSDYIEKKHHRYVEDKTPRIKELLEKICSVHGKEHPELFEVKQLFFEGAAELAAHMKKEELLLFPFIRKEVNAERGNGPLSRPFFGTIQNPIDLMQHDHDAEGERYRKISKLTNNYTPPDDACNTYKATLAMLKEFEEDLHLHIHLENNILFPKAIAAEKLLADFNY